MVSAKTAQKNKPEINEPIKVAKTVDSFVQGEDEIKLKEKKEKGEKANKKSLDYVLGVKDATIKITKLPKGFNETELFRFFKQFGDIKGVRVDRTTNGKFATQAFIRFFDAEVAKTAKEAMNGYIMFGKKLNIEILNKWVPHQDSFCPKSLISVASKMHMESLLDAKQREKEEMDLYNQRPIQMVAEMLNHRIEKENELKQKLKDFNINYKFNGYLDIVKSTLCPEATKPASKEVTKPATKEVTKPATKEVTKSATTTATKEVTKPATKEVTKPATTTATKEVSKPATKKVTKSK